MQNTFRPGGAGKTVTSGATSSTVAVPGSARTVRIVATKPAYVKTFYGKTATATAEVDEHGGVVVELVDGGTGYTSATVTIDGDGSGATATATVANGEVTDIEVTDPGVDYTEAEVIISTPNDAATDEDVLVGPWETFLNTNTCGYISVIQESEAAKVSIVPISR